MGIRKGEKSGPPTELHAVAEAVAIGVCFAEGLGPLAPGRGEGGPEGVARPAAAARGVADARPGIVVAVLDFLTWGMGGGGGRG